MSSLIDLKRRSIGLFWRASPHNEKKHKTRSDKRSDSSWHNQEHGQHP